MKVRVINILTHPPAYDLYEDEPRPVCNWDTADGRWVGVWGSDWPDLLGAEILKISGDYDYEVWQPDLRAERIYNCKLASGVKHVIYPAIEKRCVYGLRTVPVVASRALNTALSKRAKDGNIIVQVNDQMDFLRMSNGHFTRLPVVLSYLGEVRIPIRRLTGRTRNIPSKINDFCDHFVFMNMLKNIDAITYSNDVNVDYLKRCFSGRMERLAMGCDFSFWRAIEREKARDGLGLNGHRTVFFSCSNLISSKQVDKVIKTLRALNDSRDFVYVIAGHGSKDYESYLRSISQPLVQNGRIIFAGFVGEEKLRTYYSAADYFIHASIQEGASVAVIKAMACGLPVISTAVGGTAELLAEYGAGCLLSINEHAAWTKVFDEILSGSRAVLKLDRDIARKVYDWPSVASMFLDIYRELVNAYYPKKGGGRSNE